MIGIIGAMEEEVTLLRGMIDDLHEKKWGGMEFYTGKLHQKEVVLVRSRIGKVNAASATTLLFLEYKPAWVINTGSAGGLLSQVQRFGDVLIPDHLAHHDVDVTAFGYRPGQVPGQEPQFEANKFLVEQAEKVMESLVQEGVFPPATRHHRGLLVSGDSFIANLEQVTQIKKRFPEAVAVEMEAAAIAQVCTNFGIPFVVTRALSDIAGVESPMTFAEFLPIAASRSAAMVERLVKEVQEVA